MRTSPDIASSSTASGVREHAAALRAARRPAATAPAADSTKPCGVLANARSARSSASRPAPAANERHDRRHEQHGRPSRTTGSRHCGAEREHAGQHGRDDGDALVELGACEGVDQPRRSPLAAPARAAESPADRRTGDRMGPEYAKSPRHVVVETACRARQRPRSWYWSSPSQPQGCGALTKMNTSAIATDTRQAA